MELRALREYGTALAVREYGTAPAAREYGRVVHERIYGTRNERTKLKYCRRAEL